jgi:hypothetical protein
VQRTGKIQAAAQAQSAERRTKTVAGRGVEKAGAAGQAEPPARRRPMNDHDDDGV